MPVGYLTSTTLIETIKREGMIPTNQSTFTNADFLAIANQEMRIGLVPSLIQYHEEYLVVDSDAITLVANQSNYAIPYRAVGGKFRDVFYRDGSGNLAKMTRIPPEHRAYYQEGALSNRFIFYYVQGNDIILVPSVGANPTGSITFSYYLRPNELVQSTRVATITAIAEGASTTVITVDQVPTGFTTSVTYDMLQGKPGFKTLKMDISPTTLDSTAKTLTFTNANVPDSLVVGDYICFAGECFVPQVPPELHDVLSQRVVLRCLQALGDKDGYTIAASKLNEMEDKTEVLVNDRSEGHPQKVVNLNGNLRTSKIRSWGF